MFIMKNYTEILIFLLISLLSIKANAQTFGFKAGLNLSNMLDKDDDETYSDDYKMNPGFHIAGTVDIPIHHHFSTVLSFESGLLFTTRGFRIEEVQNFIVNEMGLSMKIKVNLYYIDIPLTVKASLPLSEGLKIFGAVGPYVGIGLSGKVIATVEYQGDEETDEEAVKWGSDEDSDDLKRLDYGLTFGGGVEINALMLGISYDLGLANIATYQEDGNTTKNRVLKFSVGYRF